MRVLGIVEGQGLLFERCCRFERVKVLVGELVAHRKTLISQLLCCLRRPLQAQSSQVFKISTSCAYKFAHRSLQTEQNSA